MEGKKMGEFVLEGRCPEAKELAEKVAVASDHLIAATKILEELDDFELSVEVVACRQSSRSVEGEEE